MSEFQDPIKIGTMIGTGFGYPAKYLEQVLPHGFESYCITIPTDFATMENMKQLAEDVKTVLKGSDVTISCTSVYANPLEKDDKGAQAIKAWEVLIDTVELFGADLVTGFTGRIKGTSIDQSIDRYAEVFGPLAKRASDKGVRLAFENCDMGGNWATGDWNIAHTPPAWELMFDALPDENIGLEWEPCHQMVKLIDPMPQLRKWMDRIFHVHGKDATIRWEVIREKGIFSPEPIAYHRTPGFGECNWTDIISELRKGGFKGSIDIEGWHDPVYRDELEMTGQVHALNYLKQCRGGSYVKNPQSLERD